MKKAARAVAAALLACVIVVLFLWVTGCGRDAKTGPTDGSVLEGRMEVSRTGFFNVYGDEDPELAFRYRAMACVTNPESGIYCSGLVLTSTLYDSDGQVIAAVDDRFQPLFPGSYWFLSSEIHSVARVVPARVEVAATLVRWKKLGQGAPVKLAVTECAYTTGDTPPEPSRIRGVLLNEAGEVLKGVRGVGALVDGDGNPVAGGRMSIDEAYPGRNSFDVDLDRSYSGVASVEVTPMPPR